MTVGAVKQRPHSGKAAAKQATPEAAAAAAAAAVFAALTVVGDGTTATIPPFGDGYQIHVAVASADNSGCCVITATEARRRSPAFPPRCRSGGRHGADPFGSEATEGAAFARAGVGVAAAAATAGGGVGTAGKAHGRPEYSAIEAAH